MELTAAQIAGYHDDGYVFVPGCFPPDEVEVMRAQLPGVYAEDSPARVLEAGTEVVRMVHGCHKTNEVFGRLVRDPRILRPAQQLLDDDRRRR